MHRHVLRPLIRSAVFSTRVLGPTAVKTPPVIARRMLRTASTLLRNRSDRDDPQQSFSDPHFGQERDPDEQRRKRREAASVQGHHGATTDSNPEPAPGSYSEADHEHAVISTFDLFSIGIGPSSSHTVGPMRAGKIFVTDLAEASLLSRVSKIRISLYGSLAATGEGHLTPSALLLGLECADVETVDTAYVPARFEEIKKVKRLHLGKQDLELKSRGAKEIDFEYDKDVIWEWGKTLPLHSNGMRLTVFDAEGTMLATNDMFSVGGGFVVNGALSTASSSNNPIASPSTSSAVKVSDGSVLGAHPVDHAENIFYKQIRRSDAAGDRRSGAEVRVPEEEGLSGLPSPKASMQQLLGGHTSSTSALESSFPGGEQSPRYPFRNATGLLALCKKHNLTIAQLVYENELSLGHSDEEIRGRLLKIWSVMDNSIREGVHAPNDLLPGSLKLSRRAPALYRRLTRGLYSSDGPEVAKPSSRHQLDRERADEETSSLALRSSASTSRAVSFPEAEAEADALQLRKRSGPPRVHGSFHHPIMPSPPRRTTFPAIDYLSVYAMAVNEVNAAGGRVVTAPTNGAAGVIPSVLKYTLEFLSDDPERDVCTFLLTAAAICMLYKRGATISAAEGGCMAEIGVAVSASAAAFAACMGGTPQQIEQSAEIGIEHNLGLTCDPIGGLVQAPCIERNALGAVKSIASANLALSSSGVQKVSLDDAIRAVRVTALGMRNEFKETSLSGLATSVSLNIPVSVPDC